MSKKELDILMERFRRINDLCSNELDALQEIEPELEELMKQAKDLPTDNFSDFLKNNELIKLRLMAYITELNILCSDSIKFNMDLIEDKRQPPSGHKGDNTNFEMN